MLHARLRAAAGNDAYVLDEDFSGGIPSGFGIAFGTSGAPSISYDSSDDTLVIDGPSTSQYFYAIQAVPAESQTIIEVDFEFVTDYAGREHCGFFLTDADGNQNGFRIAHLDTNSSGWDGSEWDDFLNETNSTALTFHNLVRIGAGQRRILAANFDSGAVDFYVDGVLAISDFANNISLAAPGFHAYGAKLKIHRITMTNSL